MGCLEEGKGGGGGASISLSQSCKKLSIAGAATSALVMDQIARSDIDHLDLCQYRLTEAVNHTSFHDFQHTAIVHAPMVVYPFGTYLAGRKSSTSW